jgi:uncharacterized membrane protein YraQ (UPF0718 family)
VIESLALTGLFAIGLGVLLVKWFRVKSYKVALAAAAVLVLALLFPNEPLIAFSAGIVALAVLITSTRGEEVPILQGLIGAGMGKGPALALLLAGPALSLPNMLVIRSVMGTQKTAAYVCLVVVMATISDLIYGHFYA